MIQLLAAGGERIPQVGAKLSNVYIYGSMSYLVEWTENGAQNTWNLGSTVTCVASNKETLYAGTQSGLVYKLDSEFKLEVVFEAKKSIICLDVGDFVFAGCSDGNVYNLTNTEESWRPNVRFYPITVKYIPKFDILAIGGTSNSVFLVQRKDKHYIELPGHENWVKCLDFCADGDDIVLASGAQDRYIRLWRISTRQYDTDVLRSDLTTKIYRINEQLSCVFDALLIGHDDWVVSVKWQPTSHQPQLLSASSDSSLIIWSSTEAQATDEEMQVWTPTVRLGDVSIMGASTATGATGGFWTAEWFDENKVATLGRTGSWRVWKLEDSEWISQPVLTGHTKHVTGVAWLGHSLITTSLDQTTRLWAKLSSTPYGVNSFYELNRPQIHGFDMNCVAVLGTSSIVSAGDEKLLRVFTAPNVYHDLLVKHTADTTEASSIAAASVPALGLSNKATEDSNVLNCKQLPQEAELQRLTLWPEAEKLYGHGYEIVCVDISSSGEYVASCCRANSERHAVVRVYATDRWRQLEPLSAEHTLTITRVRFSPDSKYLLSVSRDRKWATFDVEAMSLATTKSKAHSRIIWDCCWLSDKTFLTVSRDKTVKVWNLDGDLLGNATMDVPITACDAKDGLIYIGTETGDVHQLDKDLKIVASFKAEGRVNQLALKDKYLAIASDTVKIMSLA